MNENEKLLENVDVPYSTRELKAIQESNKKKDNMINLICNIVFTVIYLSSLTYGIIKAFDYDYQSKAFLIIIESFFCSIIPFGYFLVEKYFRLELKPSIRIGIEIFALLGSVVGETFEFYYRVNNFDKFLHGFSGFFIAFIVYCIAANYCKDKEDIKNKVLFATLISFLASCTIALNWEIYEHIVDVLFGTNMQKFMPENYLFNGGNTFAPLNGTAEEIAAFYSQPYGYSYALQDTMGDITIATVCTTIFNLLAITINKIAKRDVFDSLITIRKKENV